MKTKAFLVAFLLIAGAKGAFAQADSRSRPVLADTLQVTASALFFSAAAFLIVRAIKGADRKPKIEGWKEAAGSWPETDLPENLTTFQAPDDAPPSPR